MLLEGGQNSAMEEVGMALKAEADDMVRGITANSDEAGAAEGHRGASLVRSVLSTDAA
jgi:hypothetical protein